MGLKPKTIHWLTLIALVGISAYGVKKDNLVDLLHSPKSNLPDLADMQEALKNPAYEDGHKRTYRGIHILNDTQHVLNGFRYGAARAVLAVELPPENAPPDYVRHLIVLVGPPETMEKLKPGYYIRAEGTFGRCTHQLAHDTPFIDVAGFEARGTKSIEGLNINASAPSPSWDELAKEVFEECI